MQSKLIIANIYTEFGLQCYGSSLYLFHIGT